ncbi:MAG: 30S ribosomal protein S12 methylthiotransferase RimO [Desulfobulbaceae bacterium]|nr:30S ribosomal protein S12 methylthiotransferase RimO [Desulfobulbaceae bacterium]
MEKKLYLISLGCPKNLVDSEVMLGLLAEDGYRVCSSPEEADLLLVNTCGFIQPAVEESIDEILSLGQVKVRHPAVKLVVTGCLVQRYGEQLKEQLSEVDLFIGTDGFQDIAAAIKRSEQGRKPPSMPLKPLYIMDSSVPRQISTPRHRAYLKISEGCLNRCAFCLIPSLRGGLRSRPITDLIVEAKHLEEQGVKEMTLVGQDLTAYGLDLGRNHPVLTDLIEHLLAACNIPWIRLLYLYPGRLGEDLLRLMAAEPRLLSYLDLPLQHVSDSVLKRMNRPFGRSHVFDVVEKIRQIVPQAAIRTTFMVGFPGETEKDVRCLENFMTACRLDHVGIFTYSNEEGCAAERLPNQCSEEEKEERRDRLMEIQVAISLEKNQKRVGSTVEVLVEGVSPETDLLLEGRARFQAPEIDGRIYITDGHCNGGDLVNVEITEAYTYDLAGRIV